MPLPRSLLAVALLASAALLESAASAKGLIPVTVSRMKRHDFAGFNQDGQDATADTSAEFYSSPLGSRFGRNRSQRSSEEDSGKFKI